MTSPTPANPHNLVSVDRARFTVLTDRMIRLEWAEDGIFEDLATLAVAHRDTPPVEFTTRKTRNRLTLQTGACTLTYRRDDKPFSKSNLEIRFRLNGKTVTWWPGKKDRKNLKGTAQTLDGVNGSTVRKIIPVDEKDPDRPILWQSRDKNVIWQGDMTAVPLCDGLVSRNGWAVVDESSSVVLDPDLCDWQPWVRERHPGLRRDLYFLGYGHAYKNALRDAQHVFGRQPLPPRYALGYWYSRYWAYTDKELQRLVEDFDTMGLPLDVLVIDMDWHKLGWTGYSWDRDFFPDPEGLLKWLHRKGVKITLNLHPAEGVYDFEDAFPDMVREMGLSSRDIPRLDKRNHHLYELLDRDPEQARHIPLDVCDPVYMRAYFKCLHHPLENAGVDFWWMDWQQGARGSRYPNLDTLPWINELHWRDQESHHPGKRPLNFSRFGGLGAGRMPVGFSGDTHVTWESLAFQPWFTATAANVLFGSWSHDIGGHMLGTLTPELYTRWIQFGVYSPVLRTHTSKDTECERRIFHFPDPHRGVMADMMKRRYELVPYIYGEMRKTWDTGLSLLRPLYYDHPEENNAYRFKNQYLFGDDMLVAPITRPLEDKDEMAPASIWLPPGDWFDLATGALETGGRILKRRYVLEETPVFARAGAVIPEQEEVRRLTHKAYPHPVFRIVAGKSGSGILYEDDGATTAWKDGASARIRCEHQVRRNVRTVTIHPAVGTYKGFKSIRPVTLKLVGLAPPRDVSDGEWSYDGDTATTTLVLGKIDLRKGVQVRIRESGPSVQAKARHLKGVMTRLEKVRAYNCQVSPSQPVHPEERLAVRAAQTGNRIGLQPETFSGEIDQLHRILDRLPNVLREYREAFLNAGGEKAEIRASTLDRARGVLKSTLPLMRG